MLIYPAIDLMGGACVRLNEGRFEMPSVYSSHPLTTAQQFYDAGAEWLHIVDLDGARSGEPVHTAIITEIAKSTGLKVQSGGGLRTAEAVRAVLDSGVDRAIIGSMAVADPKSVIQLIKDYGADRLTVALDVREEDGNYIVRTEGWQRSSGHELKHEIAEFGTLGVRHTLITDVARDGLLAGPNMELYRGLVKRFPDMLFQASGGVTSRDHVDELVAIGVDGAIIGKALYEEILTLEELFGAG